MAWYHRLWNVFRGDRLRKDLEHELWFHVAERTDELRASGVSESEAADTARRQLGHLATHLEKTRDMDMNTGVEAMIRHVRYACRALVKAPAFTVTVVLTLALGIGANSAVFSAINAVLLRPLPFPNGDQLVKLTQSHPKMMQPFVAPVRLEEWNRLNSTLQGITGYYSEHASETSGELPEKLMRTWVAPRFLQVLGVAPAMGREFTPQEERFGGPNAVLISDKLWRRRFGADPGVLGRTLRFQKTAFTIVGIMPPSFQFPSRDVDVWSPSPPDAPYAQSRGATWFTAIARLKPGVSVAEARANLATVQAALGRQYPDTDALISATMEPLKETTVGGVRKSLWLLFGSVSLLLLIACTNIAALLLSRAAARQHEISIRFSLGASRPSVAAQLLTEVFVLALAGAGLGLAIASAASRVFARLAKDLPRVDEIALDWRIVLYSFGCAVAATLLCGIVPAVRGTSRGLSGSLACGGRSQVSGRNPLQFVLVGSQVALAVTLLAGAGLLLRSFQELGRVSPGFDPQRILTFHISTTWSETGDQKAARQRSERILDGLRSIPGVDAATMTSSLPGIRTDWEFELKTTEGRAESEPKMLAQARWVSPEYFDTLRIPLLAGELCSDEPNARTAMVNRSFANRYFTGSTPIGRRLLLSGSQISRPADIVGIVGDARETGLDREPVPTAYWCTNTMQPGSFFLVRTTGEPTSTAGTIRRKVHELEPQRSVYGLTPLTDHISDAYAENRLRTVLLAFFALTAIALASVGLYGTLSYVVNVRRREVALRMALGALRGQVVRQFLGQGLWVAVLGSAVGLALAAAFGRVLSGMLYGVSATDAATLACVVTIVLAVSIVASFLPAFRAARLDPMQALREE